MIGVSLLIFVLLCYLECSVLAYFYVFFGPKMSECSHSVPLQPGWKHLALPPLSLSTNLSVSLLPRGSFWTLLSHSGVGEHSDCDAGDLAAGACFSCRSELAHK